MLEKFFKKIHLIQEFEMNFNIDKYCFINNLKSEVNIKRTKTERFLDNFSDDKTYLKASFKEDSIRLMLEPHILLRKHFINQYLFDCVILERNKEIQLKCKVFGKNKLFYYYVFLWLFSIPFIVVYSLFTSEFIFILMGVPGILFFLVIFFLIEYIPIVSLKNNCKLVFKKAYNKSVPPHKG
jgi:hypothetical protein